MTYKPGDRVICRIITYPNMFDNTPRVETAICVIEDPEGHARPPSCIFVSIVHRPDRHPLVIHIDRILGPATAVGEALYGL